jgi:predicted  nucleic acid-binding Zn-ribbon protein
MIDSDKFQIEINNTKHSIESLENELKSMKNTQGSVQLELKEHKMVTIGLKERVEGNSARIEDVFNRL